MEPLLIILSILLLGVILTLIGLRGRVIGDGPHCRKCQFDLRGRDPASPCCPECGAELALPRAMRTGIQQRRAGVLITGLLLALLSGGTLGFLAWQRPSDADWARWKPASWLLHDLDSANGRTSAVAKVELLARIGSPIAQQAKVDKLVDAALARQADRTKKWASHWGDLIDEAGLMNRLSADRYERYLKQGTTATLTVKPRLRRGQSMCARLDISFDRLGSNAEMQGDNSTGPLLLGTAKVLDQLKWLPDGLIGGVYWTYTSLEVPEVAWIADGDYLMTGTVRMSASVAEPFAGATVNWDIPLSAPVRLHSSDATVDDFRVDPSKRGAMRGAIKTVRVKNDEEHVPMRIQFEALPCDIACEAVIVQGADEQRLGTVLLKGSQPAMWRPVHSYRKPKFSGRVNVELRPAQKAADEQETMGTYWGEPIVIRDVLVNAPHIVPFNNDQSLRPAVEKALSATITRSSSGQLTVFTQVTRPPVKLSHLVYLRGAGARETRVTNMVIEAAPNIVQDSASVADPDRSAKAFDVIFRPDQEWESHSHDLIPPWGGEVILRNVQIKTPAQPAANRAAP